MKPFDLFMPTFNSAKLLPIVLPRIEKVISTSAINKKFIVDDFSSDDTCKVAESLGWTVARNKVKGLNNAQKYGFSLVETECCAVFEHDVFLAENWFNTIPALVYSGKYDAAQGIRVRNLRGFKEADLYDYDNRFIRTEDNTFYRMGKNALPQFWNTYNFKKYCIRKDVCSIHLKGDLTTCLRHDYFISRTFNGESLLHLLKGFLHSPFLSLKVFKKNGGLSVLFVYPMERLLYFSGGLIKKSIR